jgi:hypothetical protein
MQKKEIAKINHYEDWGDDFNDFEGGDLEDLEDVDTGLSNKNKPSRPNVATDEFEGLWGNKQLGVK